MGTAKEGEGIKHDAGKLRYDLIPIEALEALAGTLTYGANKYGPNNWQQLSDFKSRYVAALFRHLAAWMKGEKIDEESGLPHLHHAFTNVAFLLYKDQQED